jgi:DNA-binding NarL/FixJ family response regulator
VPVNQGKAVKMVKFLIADDHPLYREALKGALYAEFSGALFLESDSFATTLSVLKSKGKIDLLLLDLKMPGCENFYGLLKIRQHFPTMPIAVISANDDVETISQVMEFGANAYIPKSSPTVVLVEALLSVLTGKTWLPSSIEKQIQKVSKQKVEIAQKIRGLTPKQFKVLCLLKKGLTNREIARESNVTEATIKAHVGALFSKLQVSSRTQILVAVENFRLE